LRNAKNDRLAEEIVTSLFSGRGFLRSAAKALLAIPIIVEPLSFDPILQSQVFLLVYELTAIVLQNELYWIDILLPLVGCSARRYEIRFSVRAAFDNWYEMIQDKIILGHLNFAVCTATIIP
jgi:hypothetical protein